MGKVLRISLYLDPKADPDLYRLFERLHPRRRAEKLRLLAETGMSMSASPVNLPSVGQSSEDTISTEIARTEETDQQSRPDDSATVDRDLAELF